MPHLEPAGDRGALFVSDLPPDVETPALIIDEARLEANLARMQALADRAGVRLRPHVKTHKSLELARRQLALGAVGLTASKADEAIVFLEGGAPSVTAAYPIRDGRKLARLFAAAAASGAKLNLIADSVQLASVLAEAAGAAAFSPGVFLKVDVGLGRVGVRPDDPAAVTTARALAGDPRLEFRGLLAHAGHAYAGPDLAAIAAVAERERRDLLGLADRLARAGVPAPEISVGSTPSVLGAASFDGLTEIRPGNYVFLDLTAVRLGVARLADVALSVLVTVVSRNDRYVIVDAGSKVLSSDQGPHGTAGDGFGRAFAPDGAGAGWRVARLSEEHGWVEHEGARLRPGQRLRIVPNHSCVVANLVGRAWLREPTGGLVPWVLEARGAVL